MTNIEPDEGPKKLLVEAIFLASEELSLVSLPLAYLQIDGSIFSLSSLHHPFHVHHRRRR